MSQRKSLALDPSQLQFWMIFKYADSFDVLLMIIGIFGTIGDGVSNSVLLVIASKAIHAFGSFSNGSFNAVDAEDFMDKISTYILFMVYAAIGLGVCSYLEGFCWMRTGDRQAARIRYKYLQAILQQDVGFFDTCNASTAEVINSVSADVLVVQDLISQKVPHFIMHMASFLGGYAVAFMLVWQLGIITLVLSPVLIVPGLIYGRRLARLAMRLKTVNLKASTIAEQALSSIRTVFSYVGEKRTMVSFSAALDNTVQVGLKQGSIQGLSSGSCGFAFAIWAVVSWYGSKLVMYDGVQGGKVVAVGLSTTLGGVSLGLALPDLKFYADARVVVQRIFRIIEHVPSINSGETSNCSLQDVHGNLEMRNVMFAYPARPDTIILKNLSLMIPEGKTVALVGGSGSGKSTIIALLERFYDPLAGEVLLDGFNLRTLNLKWLRMQIGLVSQEPALFSTTIMENIAYGKDNSTMEEIIAASISANAHEFIMKLPDGYNTMVGEHGIQVSGGQKQRIAIARAMLRNPAIFLLDEATSALDAQSEFAVQEALESASKGRTTVVVAHRLSTICSSDLIAVVENGAIVESGKHDDLLSQHGAYSRLVRLREMAYQDGKHSPRRALIERGTRVFGNSASSKSSVAIENENNSLERDTPSLGRLLALNKQEWRYGILGSIGAIGFGIVHPTYAFFLGNTIGVLYYRDHLRLKERIAINSSIFAVLAGLSFLVNYLQHYNFAAMGELLTNRIRKQLLQKILTFEIGWFDQDENSSAKVCSRLATEANMVRSLVADRISLSLQTAAAICTACTVGLVVSWRMAIAVIAIQPFIMVCYYTKSILLKTCQLTTLKAQGQVSQIAAEVVSNYKTIAAFSSQDRILSHVRRLEEGPRRVAIRNAHVAGFGYGAAQCMLFCSWAFDYWYGSKLLSKGQILTGSMFQTFFILVSQGRVIAEAASMTSDLTKGAGAVASLFRILDRNTEICSDNQKAGKVDTVDGHVELHEVDFSYPSRRDTLVLKKFSLKIHAGSSVALVGHSGSGKSTVISLIERFYDPVTGCVKIDGRDIRTLHLKTLRQHIALVSQEPPLFSGTISENIGYGRENATEAEIYEAAKAANAHDFICSMKNGYNTLTGERGVQLSGGQKQRIAIARAILKCPSILLLDEATSALDAQSEQLIQDSLHKLMVGRTTLIVAHRLTTIQCVASIAVIQDGRIVEQGGHTELMSKGEGVYFSLVKLQVQALT
ncbi:hypothetical protein O6H91_17G052600 [Diphasiastrum complanatum]|uniref:Uncharacterized protein n=1 Tax=Diphasiastrum complanatum TaxID=34168 RepID=A0ACC2B6S6_DIPCM|nr:hypothetical protein O6H91_17G052600 [Diphasiastrum complanatum]